MGFFVLDMLGLLKYKKKLLVFSLAIKSNKIFGIICCEVVQQIACRCLIGLIRIGMAWRLFSDEFFLWFLDFLRIKRKFIF